MYWRSCRLFLENYLLPAPPELYSDGLIQCRTFNITQFSSILSNFCLKKILLKSKKYVIFPKNKEFFQSKWQCTLWTEQYMYFPFKFLQLFGEVMWGKRFNQRMCKPFRSPPPSSFVVAGTFSQHQSPCRQYWELLYCGFSYRQTATT